MSAPEERYVKPRAEMTETEWLSWMGQQVSILHALRDYYGGEKSEAAAVRAHVALGAFSDTEIARACAEGAVCVYLKTREVKS